MKIAIQGHESRGKEVIQILKSLGTEDILDHTGSNKDWYYMRDDSLCPKRLITSSADETFLKNYGYPIYTLEEFEKEFPFKIGDIVLLKGVNKPYEVIALEWYMDKLCYKLDNGLHYAPGTLTTYEKMKQERNIKLTLDKAKEWYKKGGELKEIALQAFSEKELNPLPRSWEEFCEKYPVKRGECWIGSQDIIYSSTVIQDDRKYKNWIPSRRSAEAHLAMIQLEQLRDCWRQEAVLPEFKYKIKKVWDIYTVVYGAEDAFLSFCDNQTAEEFLECFKDLIEKAGDLI